MSLSTLYRSYHNRYFVGRGNKQIQLVKVLYCKLPTIGKKLSTFPNKGMNHPPQRLEVSVLPLYYHGPWDFGWAFMVAL